MPKFKFRPEFAFKKRPPHRPRLFQTAGDLLSKIIDYFNAMDAQGLGVSWTALCLAVGAGSRQAMQRYKKGHFGKEFADVCAWAQSIIETYWIEQNTTKSIFMLKCWYGYDEKQSILFPGLESLTQALNAAEQSQDGVLPSHQVKVLDHNPF